MSERPFRGVDGTTIGGRARRAQEPIEPRRQGFDCDLAAGRLANRRVFTAEKLPGFCDGSAIDAEGYLWNARFAGGAVVRLAPDGRVARKIELPVSNPTSCCFGGPELATLYVTSARFSLSDEQLRRNPLEGALLALDAGVRGTPSHRFAG